MFKKIIAASFILSTLSACGGGGGGGGGSTPQFTTLSVLSNGDGIARGVTTSGEEALIYSPEIVSVVSSANSASSSDIANVSASDFPVTSVDGNARIRTGTMSSDGITLNVTAVEDIGTTDAAVVFLGMPAGYNDIIVTSGSDYSNPPTGSHTYSGTQMTTSSNGSAPGAIGSFSMTADFGQETFAYSGSSGGISVSGSGVLDTTNGRYATSGLSVNNGGTNYSGTMHGLLHGNGAHATSGVFHTSGSSPAYTGSFVGSR